MNQERKKEAEGSGRTATLRLRGEAENEQQETLSPHRIILLQNFLSAKEKIKYFSSNDKKFISLSYCYFSSLLQKENP
jgi:hypothetical protein